MASEEFNLVGTRLNHYALRKEIGKGGMGTVYLGEVVEPWSDLVPGDLVAVKVVHPHLLATREALDRFRREASLGLKIRHPNIVRTIDIGEESRPGYTLHYLVTEYVRGQTLRDLQLELGWLGEELVLHIAIQCASALASIHETGIVHRDVKPENVLITEDNVVRLMDLGVARPLWQTARLSRTGQFVGSVLYAAPEQFRSPDKMDGRADLYALGLVIYGLLTGEHPFDRTDIGVVIENHIRRRPKPPSEVNPDISPFIEALVLTLLRKQPDDRFASAQDLLEVLEKREESPWWKKGAGGLRSGSGLRPTSLPVDRATPLIGRDREIARLRSAADRAADGETVALVLRGEEGMGKSRLVDRLLRDLTEERSPLRPMVATAPARTFGTAGGMIREALLSGLSSFDVVQDIDVILPPDSPRRETCAAFLTGRPIGEAEGDILPRTLPGLLNELIGRLASRGPLLIVLEDIHAADEGCLTQLPMLARACRRRPVLLLLTTRQTSPGSPPAESILRIGEELSLETVEIGQLDRGDVERLLRHTLDEDLSRRLAPKVGPAAGGNPRQVLEILRDLREKHRLVQDGDGVWTVVGSIDRIDMPTSVRERIQGRVAALSEEERALLETLAVIGSEADADLLAAVLDREVLAVLRALGRMERLHGLVRSARGVFSPDHDRVREVVLEEMPEELGRRIHERVAESLESDCPDPASAPPERALLLARHLAEAGRWPRAFPLLPLALAHLERQRRFREVLELSTRALEQIVAGTPCESPIPGLVGLAQARALRATGRADDERRELERLARTVSGAMRARVSVELAWSFYRAGDLDPALNAASLGLQDAQSFSSEDVECDALRCLGAVAFAGGRLTEASRYLEDALALSRHRRSEEAEGAILRTLGMVRAGFQDLDAARADLTRALEIARRLQDPGSEAACLGNLALVHREAGEPRPAREDQIAALEIFREIGDRDGEARALSNLALAEEDLGLVEEAQIHHRRAARRLQAIGDRRGLAVTRTNLGLLLESLGEYAAAHDELRRALEIARALEDDALGASALAALGIVAHARGDLGAAIEALMAAQSLHEEQSEWRDAAVVALDLARFLAAVGRTDEARDHLAVAERQAEVEEDPELADAAQEAAMDVAFRAGDFGEVLAAFARLAEPTGSPTRQSVRREIRCALARLELGHDDARLSLEWTLAGAGALADPAPGILSRLGLALAGRDDPNVLTALTDGGTEMRLEDQLLAYWMGYRLEHRRGEDEAARSLLEAAYYLIHRARATLPDALRDGYERGAFPQREILAAWEAEDAD